MPPRLTDTIASIPFQCRILVGVVVFFLFFFARAFAAAFDFR